MIIELHKLLCRQLSRTKLSKDSLPQDIKKWQEFLDRVNRFYQETDQDRYLLQRSMELSSHEMHDMNTKLEEAQQMASLGYWYHDNLTGENIWSKELYKMFKLDFSKPAPNIDAVLKLIKEEDRPKIIEFIDKAFSQGEGYETEIRMKSIDGIDDYRWYHVIGRPKKEIDEPIHQLTGIAMDITQRKMAEQKVNSLQQQLLTSARRAGMADVATSILHNVGNILNSVNVSINLINEYMAQSNFNKLLSAMKMIMDQKENMGEFINHDKKGKLILQYLMTYMTKLQNNHQLILDEIQNLTEHLNHIKTITEMQKTLSGVSGLIEKIYLPEVIDSALNMCTNLKDIHIVKKFDELPFISTDKSKLIQIIVNLIQNAKDALYENRNNKEKKIIIAVKKHSEDSVLIQIKDNGIGIAEDKLIKIFSFGFTTKIDGHGFGLHSSALAAKELGGTLEARSEGLGQGATFNVILPFIDPQRRERYENKTEFTSHCD